MADHATSKLNPESHLILDQPLLRLPYELLRNNFKAARLSVEKESAYVRNGLKEVASGTLTNATSPADAVKSLDGMIARMRGLKRKLNAYSEEETRLQEHSRARVRHLAQLYAMQSLDDVKYEAWSRTRLNRLLVDYMLRSGYQDSAMALAAEKGIEELVDVDAFVQMNRIRESLLAGRISEALAWCQENKKELRRMDSNLEFMIRLQQYIELVRSQDRSKFPEAIAHAKKYLLPFKGTYPQEIFNASGLLAYPPDTQVSVYKDLYSPDRWASLANLFMQTHNTLLSLPAIPLLHVALSSGLSALKTPSCHSSTSTTNPSANSAIGTSVCPICSTELNALARNVPYAHHTKSHTPPDCVVLPNNRVYSRAVLDEYSRKGGLAADQVKDLRTGDVYAVDDLCKVYIS